MMNNNEEDEMRDSLNLVFEKVKTQNTVEEGLELLGVIIKEINKSGKMMNSLFQQLISHNQSLSKADKKESLILLTTIYQSIGNIKLLYPYIDKILFILQSSIDDDTISLYPSISKAFSETTMAFIAKDSIQDHIHIAHDVIDVYEKMKMFCINNMKSITKPFQIVGTLCLTNFIEACSLNYKNDNLKTIWENIIYLIDKKTFNAKLELLNCLISLIFSSESAFRPFATVTLYKILDYLTDNDWLKRKLALNVVYTLVFYCQSEIISLHEYITEFLEVLRNDKVAEVREVCLQTLQFFNDNALKPIKETDNRKSNPKKVSSKASLKKNSCVFSTIKQLGDTNISKEDIERRSKTPLMKNGHPNNYFAQRAENSSKKFNISTKKITFPKKNNNNNGNNNNRASSSIPKICSGGDLSYRNATRDKDKEKEKEEKLSNSNNKNEKTITSYIGDTIQKSNNTQDHLGDISFKLQTYIEIHTNHINSLNESIQGLAQRVRLMENQLDIKLRKDKRKFELKVEKKNKNYDKAFQIALELRPKYLIQIIRRMKEKDYQMLNADKFDDSLKTLFNDIDEISKDIYLVFSYINNVIKNNIITFTKELADKVLTHCNEVLSLKEEFCLDTKDVELITQIVNHLN